ncbi:MAG TPA: hypothetical protein VIU46_07965 [Gallionellaceae bacterium]
MLRKLIGTIAIAAGAAGCASAPPDTTPLNPTAIIEKHINNNGIKGFFPFEINDANYVRTNMRRYEHELKGTGTFSGFIVGTHSGTSITRLDRKLVWSLDTKHEEYTECPLKGCVEKTARPAPKVGQAQQQPEAPHEQGCTLRMASSSFTVTPTGQKKTINGFDTEQYQALWTVVLRDKDARTTTSKVSLDLWTTPLTQNMRDALAMDAAYAHAYAGAMPEEIRAQPVPEEAAKLMASYLAKSLSPADQAAFLAGARQMSKIKGYPISSQLSWNMNGNACAPKEPAKKAEDSGSHNRPMPSSASGLASGLAGMFVEKKAKEAVDASAGEPILSFTMEVKQLKVEPRHDSLFEVPTGYHRIQPQ